MPMTTIPPKIYQRCYIPRPPDMEDYLSRIWEISSRLVKPSGTPDPPPDMERLDFQEANNIELALIGAERAINAMENSWVYSGEIESGGF